MDGRLNMESIFEGFYADGNSDLNVQGLEGVGIFSRLTAVRSLMEFIYRKFKLGRWDENLNGKIVPRKLAELCDLMTALDSSASLRLMIESKDPWLWLAGAAFIGIEAVHQKDIFNALDSGVIRYSDHSSFLQLLSALMRSKQFISIRKNNRRTELQVEKSLFEYMRHLNALHSKLMVLRVDFSYGKMYTLHIEPERRVVADWEALLNYIRQNFFASFLGYVAKFEYGQEKGVHVHTLIFLDGRVVRQDATIARHLGEVWVNSITKGVGIYFNANTPSYKSRMKNSAIGNFGKNDATFLLEAKDIARYFAKRDPIATMAIPGIGRTLRRSNFPSSSGMKCSSFGEE